jgi:RNA polymerase sigma-70 factor (ECF subfamily)
MLGGASVLASRFVSSLAPPNGTTTKDFETKRNREHYKDTDILELAAPCDGQGRDGKLRLMEDDIRHRLDAKQYREAFELLMDRFQNKVFRLAFSMVRNETMAEDLTQEVFMKIWKALPSYHGDASLSTWIYTITRNTCLTDLKKRNARPTISFDEPELEDALQKLPTCQTSDREAGAEMDIQVMLARLPEKYRRVITLFYLEQKSYEEVSAMLGIPMGTVKTFLFRAKKELLKFNRRNENVYA